MANVPLSGRGERPIFRQDGSVRLGREVLVELGPAASHFVIGSAAVLEIGDQTHFSHGVAIAVERRVRIGSHCALGPLTMISDSDFHIAGSDKVPEPRPIEIGDRVRIGAWSMIMPGAQVGDDVVVDPGSIVTGYVPAGARIAGNPAALVGQHDSGREERNVEALICEVLELDAVPASSASTSSIQGWDSLCSLRLLLTIEREYGVVVDERLLTELKTVEDWVRLGDDQ